MIALRRALIAPVVSALVLAAPSPPRSVPALRLKAPVVQDFPNAPYDGKVHFVRLRYDVGGGGGFGFGRRRGYRDPPWHHDYPRSDTHFMKIMEELTDVPVLVGGSNVFDMDDPRLFEQPFAYLSEPGYWNPTDREVEGLREYLEKGGFLVVDDFRGPQELANLEFHLRRVFPADTLTLVDTEHDIFDSFFRIDPYEVLPPYGGRPPYYLGIFENNDPHGRLQVIINYNNDIGEYWEFSDQGFYPIDLSNDAYKLGVNYLVYALTH